MITRLGRDLPFLASIIPWWMITRRRGRDSGFWELTFLLFFLFSFFWEELAAGAILCVWQATRPTLEANASDKLLLLTIVESGQMNVIRSFAFSSA